MGDVFSMRRGEAVGDLNRIVDRLSLWKRVWIDEAPPPPKPRSVAALRPWTVEWTSAGFAYVLDAEGNKIASLLGPQKRRENVAAILCDLGMD